MRLVCLTLVLWLAQWTIPSTFAEDLPVASPLGDLDPESVTQGWGNLQTDKAVAGTPLTIGGRTFAHGLGTHAISEIVYDLDGNFERFTGWVGVDDHLKKHPEGPKASVVFQVFGDGKKLFDSGVMRIGQPAKQVDVSLARVKELKLVVTDAGDGISCDHADWAEPILLGKGLKKVENTKAKYEVKAAGIALRLDENGYIVNSLVGRQSQEWPMSGQTRLGRCKASGKAILNRRLDNGGCEFTREVINPAGRVATVTDRYTPDGKSIRWDIEITSPGEYWSTPIISQVACSRPESKLFWTAWGSPDFSSTILSPALAAMVSAGKAAAKSGWNDPLVPVGFVNRTWHYGNVAQSCPVDTDYIAVPLCSILDPQADTGVSLVLSPADILLYMDLSVRASGQVKFQRTQHRLGGGKGTHWTMHLLGHEASWRGGLRFLTTQYPEYFEAPNPRTHQVGGCGAYSIGGQEIDVAKFKKMAFGFNWKLSDDFPYMGMFIPPVQNPDLEWERSCDERSADHLGRFTSCRKMNDYARYMKQNGFAVLSYFNVTEFGKNMYGRKPARSADDPQLWKDPAGYIKYKLPHTVVDPGIRTCYGAYIVDPGDPDYAKFLLEQAERNTRLLPDVDGICIDRADWLRINNHHADDNVSWVNGKPARLLFRSWLDLMSKLGPQLHQADKLIYSNLMTMRLELCRELDGIYTEFGNVGGALNASALLGLRKPVVCWTYNATLGDPAPDAFMQRHLYMGCFPTAPYPYNNHCINPEPKADRLYLDYGPLFSAMRGKKWVLLPHCVQTTTYGVKVNLFEVPGGYALPVTFGGEAKTATVRLQNLPGTATKNCCALHPGQETPSTVKTSYSEGVLEITVPLVRGCAMITLR